MAKTTASNFTSLRNVSKEQAVYDQIRRAITSGDMAAGQRLISAEIGEQLGVSSMPVRNALMRLEAEGLVTRIPHREFVVTLYSSRDVRELYAVRAALDSLAGRLAAGKTTPDRIETLRGILARSEVALEGRDLASLRRINGEFHTTIYGFAENRHLLEIIQGLRARLPVYHEEYYGIPGMAEKSVADHHQVLEALAAARADLVESLLRQDMETTGETLAKIVERREESEHQPESSREE
jgi:DNA-binding GntR family transcriptional regulator